MRDLTAEFLAERRSDSVGYFPGDHLDRPSTSGAYRSSREMKMPLFSKARYSIQNWSFPEIPIGAHLQCDLFDVIIS